jgi:4-amino-4-deoxy-L-arabinose transferase-like glycosyltransferase
MRLENDRRQSDGSIGALFAVAGVALLASLIVVFFIFGRQSLVRNIPDPYGYGAIARGFLEHGFDKVTRRAAMLYPHLLALIYWSGGTDFVVQMLQCLFHAGTCILVFLIGRRLYNVRTGLLAGLFTAVHPMLLRYVADLQTETMLVFACTLAVWSAIRFYDRPTVANGVLLGVIGMLATLTKGIALPPVVAFLAVWFLISIYREGLTTKAVSAALAVVLSMAVVVAPWTYRNYRVSGGRFVLLTPGASDAFLRGYIFTRLEFATLKLPPYTYAENESNAMFRRIAREAKTQWELDEIVDEANNKAEAKRMIAEHPLDTVRKCLVGLLTFWYEMTSFTNSLVSALLALGSWILALIGWRRAHSEGRPSWLLLLPIAVTNLVVAVLIPLGRYSVPILPCLAVLAAFGLDTLLTQWSVMRGRSPHRPQTTLEGSAGQRTSSSWG